MATATGEILRLVRKGIDVRAVHAHTRKPFRLYLCGDPALVASMRSLLLSGHDESVQPDAAACLETIVPGMAQVTMTREGRAILFLGRRGDALGADFDSLRSLELPIFAITVDEGAQPSGPASPPAAGVIGEYVVTAVTKEALRGRVFPHIVERCKGVEIAVGGDDAHSVALGHEREGDNTGASAEVDGEQSCAGPPVTRWRTVRR